MTARIIDGKLIAAELRARVADEVARVQRETGLARARGGAGRQRSRQPGLCPQQAQADPGSRHGVVRAYMPADVAQTELLALIAQLNRDPAVHGILVQLPLPKSLDTEAVINAIDPAKDVTVCIRTMPGGSPAGLPRFRRARRSAASS